MHPEAATVAGPIVERPDFTPPARPENAPMRNMMLETGLGQLRVAFDRLAEAPGGDLGGLRATAGANIAVTAAHLLEAMNEANAAVGVRRGRAGRGQGRQ
jgi:hypothetical protein